MSRTIRQRTTPPKRERDREWQWSEATCTRADDKTLWDYEVRSERGGSDEQRRRWAEAQQLCRRCPALAICAATDHDEAAGIIAGRLIKPKVKR